MWLILAYCLAHCGAAFVGRGSNRKAVHVCHVLVIEDEWLVACHLADVAQRAGGTSISMAAAQREAVAKARSERPGIILSDVLLREGTGPLAVETIIAEQGFIPV